jgi:hypothetical protein
MVQQRLQLIVALEKLEDTKVVTRSRKAKKDRQLIIQWPTRKTDNRTNNDTPNFTKDQTTGTPLNTGGELSCSGRISSSCSTCKTLYISNYCIFLLKIFWYCFFCSHQSSCVYDDPLVALLFRKTTTLKGLHFLIFF